MVIFAAPVLMGILIKLNARKKMLIIEVKENENIDRALKRYKRKFQNAGVMKELRNRKEFKKPSVKRRNEILKAVYKAKRQQDLMG